MKKILLILLHQEYSILMNRFLFPRFRRIILTALYCVMILHLNAQYNFNRSVHEKSESATTVLEVIGDDYYFITNSLNNASFRAMYLYKYNKQGNQVFRKSVPVWPLFSFRTIDHKLILIGQLDYCDVVPQYRPYYLTGIDTNGTVLFSDTLTGNNGVIQYVDSTFIGFYNGKLYRYSKNGQFISTQNTGLTGILTSLLLPNGNILVSSVQGFSEINISGTVLWTKAAAQLTRMKFYGGNKILGTRYGGQALYRFTQSGDFTDSISFASYLNDFVQKNDTIYAITNTECRVMDTSFVSISTSSATTEQVSFAAIRKNGTGTAILSSYYTSLQPPSTFVGYPYAAVLNVFDGYPYQQFSKDLAMISVEQDSANLINGLVSLSAKVRVKNKGSAPVSNFRLNCFRYPRVDCGGYYYQEAFNANIPAGDSVTVTTPFISRFVYSSQTSANFCIYVSLPDGEADKHLADNEICTDVDLTVLGIASLSAERTLDIFPNPFGSSLEVRGEEISRIELSDCLGNVIIILDEPTGHAAINTGELNSGIYFVKVFTRNGVIVQKVIKA